MTVAARNADAFDAGFAGAAFALLAGFAAGLAVVGFTSAYLIFIAKAMPLAPVTVISLLVDLGACAVLFLTEARIDLQVQKKPRRVASAARRRHA